ncbi:MAG: site-2 protease family protein [Sphingorhabdus sp.]
MNIGETAYNLSIWIIPLIIAIVFHEVAHGWVANFFGDPTAKNKGRLSFNPIGHVDPIGTLALPAILAVTGAPIFGWAKPVPVIKSRLRNPRLHMMVVAVAGPGMNFILALFGAIMLAVLLAVFGNNQAESLPVQFFADNFFNFILINIFLGVFNLIPLPPFDGSHITEGLLPASIAKYYRKLARYSFPILIILLVVLPMLLPGSSPVAELIVPPVQFLTNMYLSLVGLGS